MRTASPSRAPQLLLAAGVWLLLSAPGAASTPAQPGTPLLPAGAERSLSAVCSPHSYLQARLRGARDLAIDWHGTALQCAGGPRPDGRGFRMTFAGPISGGHRLRLVFGLATPLHAGTTHEVPANVTLIFEGERRLYSTRGDGQCTIDRLQQQVQGRDPGGQRALLVSARGFCVGPAGALGASAGTGGVAGQGDEMLLSRFDFQALVSASDGS